MVYTLLFFGYDSHSGVYNRVSTRINKPHFKLRLELNEDEWCCQQYFSFARIRVVHDKSQRVKVPLWVKIGIVLKLLFRVQTKAREAIVRIIDCLTSKSV